MNTNETDSTKLKTLSEGSGTEDLIQYIDTLPSERKREWELRLTRLIENASTRVDDIEQIFRSETITAERESEFVRFAAFFAYCTYHRRQGNISELGSLLRKYDEFEPHPMFPHLQALHAKRIDTDDSYQMAVNHARETINRVGSDHPGVTHSLATAIIDVLEEERSDVLGPERERLLEEAEKFVELALDQSEYPKFRATYGRILALQGEHDEGIQQIHRALDMEDASKDDYAIRINTYRSHEFKMFLDKYTQKISRDQQDIREKQKTLNEEIDDAIGELETIRSKSETRLREIQTQTLQFLGFFATLLAVIVSSINITTSFPLPEAAALILVLTGGLLAAFGGFTIVLPIDDVERKSIALFTMGTVLSGIGMTVVFQL